MRRFSIALGCLVGVASCAPVDLPVPEGAGQGDRFFALDPAALGPCGPVGTMPARGRLPALGALRGREGVLLLELDGVPISSHYRDDEPVPVQRITEHGFDDGLDVVPLDPPIQAWTLDQGSFTEATVPADLRLALITKTACVPRLLDRCAHAAPIDDRCAQFEEIIDVLIPSSIDHGLGAVLPLDRDRALAGAKPSPARMLPERFFLTDAARSEPRSIGAPPGMPYLAAFRRTPDDDIFIYGPGASLGRATPDLDLTLIQAPRRPGAQPTAAWIDGPHDTTSPFELYALDQHGWFERFDGESWAQLTGELPEAERSAYGGVAWIAPGEAVAAGSRRSTVLRYKQGALHIETFARGTEDRATAIAFIAGIGTVIGTDRGVLYADADNTGAWVQLESPLDDRPVHGIAPFRSGFVFGRSLPTGSGGQVVEYVPGFGLCDSVRVTYRDVQSLHPIEDGFVVYSKDADTDPFVGFVRRKNAYPECAAPAN